MENKRKNRHWKEKFSTDILIIVRPTSGYVGFKSDLILSPKQETLQKCGQMPFVSEKPNLFTLVCQKNRKLQGFFHSVVHLHKWKLKGTYNHTDLGSTN